MQNPKPQTDEALFIQKLISILGSDYYRHDVVQPKSIQEILDAFYADANVEHATNARRVIASIVNRIMTVRGVDVFPLSQAKDVSKWLKEDPRIKVEINLRNSGSKVYKAVIAALDSHSLCKFSKPTARGMSMIVHIVDPYLRSFCDRASEERIRGAYLSCKMDYDSEIARIRNETSHERAKTNVTFGRTAVPPLTVVTESAGFLHWYEKNHSTVFGSYLDLSLQRQLAFKCLFDWNENGSVPEGLLKLYGFESKYDLHTLEASNTRELFVSYFEDESHKHRKQALMPA